MGNILQNNSSNILFNMGSSLTLQSGKAKQKSFAVLIPQFPV